ncbi:UNKNOWN [Stylonychia lemnae]|uniref:Leucine Rich Repeat family protein n=1 Tax=Stylonychia lemnae TaxID=5949 RepID=A0A078A5T8_STYLE|nr:UNKNOWN [Stylonychia lemnae]|eukprot:CDW77554.1 UNKNOWN [Stylonychia lemnae]
MLNFWQYIMNCVKTMESTLSNQQLMLFTLTQNLNNLVMISPFLINIDDLDINLSGRSINERNFDTLLQTLIMCNCRIGSLNLSYNLFFKDHSLKSLIEYLEQKTSALIQHGCRNISFSPILKSIRIGDQNAVQLIEATVYSTQIKELNLAQNGLGFKTGSALVNLLQEIKLRNKQDQLKLTKLELSFNLISDSMIKRIQCQMLEFQQQQLEQNQSQNLVLEQPIQNSISKVRKSFQTPQSSQKCNNRSNQKYKDIQTNIKQAIQHPLSCINRSIAQTPIRTYQQCQPQSSTTTNKSTNRSFTCVKSNKSLKLQQKESQSQIDRSYQKQNQSLLEKNVEFNKYQSAQEYDFNQINSHDRQKLLLVRKNLSKLLQSKLSRQSDMADNTMILSSIKSDNSIQFQQNSQESQSSDIPSLYLAGEQTKKHVQVSQDLRNQIPQITQFNTETIDQILHDDSQLQNIKEYLQGEVNKYQLILQQIEQHESSNKQTQQVKQLVNNLKFLKDKLYYNTCKNSSSTKSQIQNMKSMKENVYPDSTAQFSIVALRQIDEDVLDLKQSDRYTQSSNRSYIQANFDQKQ